MIDESAIRIRVRGGFRIAEEPKHIAVGFQELDLRSVSVTGDCSRGLDNGPPGFFMRYHLTYYAG
jgi:hypothetical protein